MIVRIQSEGQYEVADEAISRLDELDNRLYGLMQAGDESAFCGVLGDMISLVKREGTPLPIDRLVPSDVILPPSDISLDEARQLLTDEGFLRPVEA